MIPAPPENSQIDPYFPIFPKTFKSISHLSSEKMGNFAERPSFIVHFSNVIQTPLGNGYPITYTLQWRIQDFPDGGAPTPEGGAPTYYLTNFSQKLHENEENLTQRGGARVPAPPLDPPMHWIGG